MKNYYLNENEIYKLKERKAKEEKNTNKNKMMMKMMMMTMMINAREQNDEKCYSIELNLVQKGKKKVKKVTETQQTK